MCAGMWPICLPQKNAQAARADHNVLPSPKESAPIRHFGVFFPIGPHCSLSLAKRTGKVAFGNDFFSLPMAARTAHDARREKAQDNIHSNVDLFNQRAEDHKFLAASVLFKARPCLLASAPNFELHLKELVVSRAEHTDAEATHQSSSRGAAPHHRRASHRPLCPSEFGYQRVKRLVIFCARVRVKFWQPLDRAHCFHVAARPSMKKTAPEEHTLPQCTDLS